MWTLLIFFFVVFEASAACPSVCECLQNADGTFNVTCTHKGLKDIPRQDLPKNTVLLNCGFNQIRRIKQEDFTHVPMLRTLLLSFNQISYIAPDAFQDLINLSYISLQFNDHLNLSPNWWSVICGRQKLRDLRVQKTNSNDRILNKLVTCLANLDNFETLDISANPIDNLTGLSLGRLYKLRWLHVARIPSWKGHTLALRNLTNLEHLDISDNHLTQIPSFLNNGHSLLPKLRRLDIPFNYITALPTQPVGLETLTILNLMHNHLRCIDDRLNTIAPNIRQLHLGLNKLSSDCSSFNVSTLEHLNMVHCNLYIYPKYEHIFWNLPNVKVLVLTNNIFSAMSYDLQVLFKNNLKLEYLDLRTSQLTMLSAENFSNLKHLQRLDLGGNKIKYLPEGVFAGLASLKILNLAGNHLISLRRDIFSPILSSLETFSANGNPYTCDCDLQWFVSWFRQNQTRVVNVYSPREYTCTSPAHLKGTNLYELDPEDLCP